jgi:hypothetical protein
MVAMSVMSSSLRRVSSAVCLVVGFSLLGLVACGGDDVLEVTVVHGPVPPRGVGAQKVHRTYADATGLSGLRRTTARTDWTSWTSADADVRS